MILILGGIVPNTSFAASPFLVKHSSVVHFEQSGHGLAQGRATFINDAHNDENKDNTAQTRKPLTLAESLVHMRQHQAPKYHLQSNSSHEAQSPSKKVFVVQPQN